MAIVTVWIKEKTTMNKDEMEMIEEMAKVLYNLEDCCNTKGCAYNDEDGSVCYCQYFYKYKNGRYGCVAYATAEALYNANYRKVGEDEIVIKKSEQKQWLKDCIESNKKTEEIARKQTAREILQDMYDYCKDDDYGQVMVDFSCLETLARKYGIELED